MAVGPPEHRGKDNPSSSQSSLAWPPNTQALGTHAGTPGPTRLSARGPQSQVPSAVRCHPWLGQLCLEPLSASDSPQIKAFSSHQAPWNGQSDPAMAGAAACPSSAADPDQKAGNLTTPPTLSYPGNTRKDHGAKSSHQQCQRGLGTEDTCGTPKQSQSWASTDQGAPERWCGILQRNPSSGASGLHPQPWGRIRAPHASTANMGAPPEPLLPLVPRARTSASAQTRRVIFIPSHPGWDRNPPRALPPGRLDLAAAGRGGITG